MRHEILRVVYIHRNTNKCVFYRNQNGSDGDRIIRKSRRTNHRNRKPPRSYPIKPPFYRKCVRRTVFESADIPYVVATVGIRARRTECKRIGIGNAYRKAVQVLTGLICVRDNKLYFLPTRGLFGRFNRKLKCGRRNGRQPLLLFLKYRAAAVLRVRKLRLKWHDEKCS